MSCLFLSLASAVGYTPDHLRAEIIRYLRTDPVLIDSLRLSEMLSAMEDISLETYTAHMSNPLVWGGGIEIKAFVDIFNMNVIVHTSTGQIPFLCKNACEKSVHIQFTGNHYEPYFCTI